MSETAIPKTSITFFDTRVDILDQVSARRRLRQLLDRDVFSHVVTPNTEMIIRARRDRDFRALINQADVCLPDGIGLVWFGRWLNPGITIERVSGADLVNDILKIAEDKGLQVVFLGNKYGIDQKVAERAAAIMQKQYPELKMTGVTVDPDQVDLDLLKHLDPAVLIVGFGAPRQDFWIDAYHAELPHLRLAMGAGATLDFIAGAQKRAPQWMQQAGLEWLWRLLHRPTRIIRQLAIPYFMWLCLLVKLKIIPNRALR